MDIQSLLQALVPQRHLIPAGLESLKPGDQLSGRIVEHRPDGQTLVDFGQFRALADLKVSLPADALINVRVMETGDKVHMQIVNPAQGTQTALEVPLSRFEILTGDLFQQLRNDIQQLLASAPRTAAQSVEQSPAQATGAAELGAAAAKNALPAPVRTALAQVQAHLDPVNPRIPMDQLAARLRALVSDSGVYFEKNLEQVLRVLQDRLPGQSLAELGRHPQVRQLFQEDLKPNLLVLKDNLAQMPGDRSPALETALNRVRVTVDQMLADIDHQQRQILSRAFGPEPEHMISHWLHLQDRDNLSRLKIFHRKSKQGDPDAAPRVSLLLDMDRLGDVRTDLFLSGELLNLHFFVTGEAVKSLVEANLEELQTNLAEVAEGVSIQVSVSKRKVAQLKTEPPLPAGDGGMVNIKA